MHKYHARKTERDGHMFDSKAEARRYEELKAMQEAGEIADLELQPRILLFDSFRAFGRSWRKTEYVADFAYERDGVTVYEDVKSPATRTEVYMLKRKLAAMLGYEVLEIMPKKA